MGQSLSQRFIDMATVESQLTTLETEAAALKAAFEQSATSLTVAFSGSITCATTANMDQYGNYADETVQVTLATTTGANTLATIELETDSTYLPIIRRVPYSGGARWRVTIMPKNGYYASNWTATNFTFYVHAFVSGELSAEASN